MTTNLNTSLLRRAGIAFSITGLGYLAFGFPFWFLGAQDEVVKGKVMLSFFYLRDELFPAELNFWIGFIGIAAMFFGLFSLWKIAEPTGLERRSRFYFPMTGAVFYFLGLWMPVPFAPMGAFLTGLGMIIVGLASIKAKMWPGWKRYIPLIVGCFPFVFMFPLLIITGARPPAMIGLWGFPWIAMGVAAWQRSKEGD
ncbi:MAG TPA: hypothetical protein PLC89_15055 [Haliscomenobacter sp.]|uniref:hypothetical protein n=1 Tax=Haliscomenobacter sp. TaxID=2717303 RepID=UPI002BEB0CE2|nr:hypothetical protein [Haliscomenobacter sp.]HOY18618.1 hypothetical protein [Haliscomenobacter sp.]HPH17470.1 hypothetical protein [Haliscomenobacter sp.]